jgi:hypothetical protein
VGRWRHEDSFPDEVTGVLGVRLAREIAMMSNPRRGWTSGEECEESEPEDESNEDCCDDYMEEDGFRPESDTEDCGLLSDCGSSE